MSRILITGSKGQLGSDLVEWFSDTSYDVNGFSHEMLDIADKSKVMEVVRSERPNWILNCAAFTDLDKAEINDNKALEVNFQGTKNLAEACEELDIGMLHISTDAVFESTEPKFFETTDQPRPINRYGISKLMGEQAIIEISSRYWILRSSWIYGQHGSKFFNSILRKISNSEDVEVVSDQFGQPSPTILLYSAILEILDDKIPSGIHHLVPREFVSRFDFALMIKQSYESVSGLTSNSKMIPTTTAKRTEVAPRAKYSLLSPSRDFEQIADFPASIHDQIRETVHRRERRKLA